MKIIFEIPKEAVQMAVGFAKMQDNVDLSDAAKESESNPIEIKTDELKELLKGTDFVLGMTGLAGYALLKLKERKETKK